MATSYKPSPLSFGSPRASPFRRPDSPASPSPLRQATPNPSPVRMSTQTATTPSKVIRGFTPVEIESWSPRGLPQPPTRRDQESTPSPVVRNSPGFGGLLNARSNGDNNALSKLQPAQVRELREGFQILDRDSDGQIVKDDVVDMLTQLGLSSNPSDLSAYFVTSQSITLPAYLNSMAGLLASLSPSSELLSAFSAFDEDDSGQVDLAELRDALLHTAPEMGDKPLSEREIDRVMSGFIGRRAFGKQTGGGMGKRGEVFKYQEFVASVQGGVAAEGKDGKGGGE